MASDCLVAVMPASQTLCWKISVSREWFWSIRILLATPIPDIWSYLWPQHGYNGLIDANWSYETAPACVMIQRLAVHNDVKCKHFPRYWPFLRGIHRSPVNSPHKSQWRGALMFSLICAWINGWVNNCEAADLRRHRTHYDVTVMISFGLGFALYLLQYILTDIFYFVMLTYGLVFYVSIFLSYVIVILSITSMIFIMK